MFSLEHQPELISQQISRVLASLIYFGLMFKEKALQCSAQEIHVRSKTARPHFPDSGGAQGAAWAGALCLWGGLKIRHLITRPSGPPRAWLLWWTGSFTTHLTVILPTFV